jgi:hypothetical protein
MQTNEIELTYAPTVICMVREFPPDDRRSQGPGGGDTEKDCLNMHVGSAYLINLDLSTWTSCGRNG